MIGAGLAELSIECLSFKESSLEARKYSIAYFCSSITLMPFCLFSFSKSHFVKFSRKLLKPRFVC